MRALIVTNMYPTAARPALGSFVRDQVDALRRIDGIDLDVFSFAPGGARAYAASRRRPPTTRPAPRHEFDVVHAHYGLTAWPAFAASGKVRAVTLHGTDLVPSPRPPGDARGAAVPRPRRHRVRAARATEIPRWAVQGRRAVLPAGVDIGRFRPIPRARGARGPRARPDSPYLLFPADPRRPEKRYDRARAVAGNVPLLTLGQVDPDQVPLYVNAANAVLVPSEREGFGLAVLEALACDVPGARDAGGDPPDRRLTGSKGRTAGRSTKPRGATRSRLTSTNDDPRIDGRASAEEFSTDRMAAEVVTAWRTALER